MTIEYRVRPPLANETLNALFSIGWPSWQTAPDTSDWQPVLKRRLVYICAFDAERLIGFVNVAWDGRDTRSSSTRASILIFECAGLERHLSREPRMKHETLDANGSTSTFYETCGFRPTATGLIHLSESSVTPAREETIGAASALR